jgi:hypothetical protein
MILMSRSKFCRNEHSPSFGNHRNNGLQQLENSLLAFASTASGECDGVALSTSSRVGLVVEGSMNAQRRTALLRTNRK